MLSTKKFNLVEPVEDGESFEENALIKARYYAKTNLLSLADDSGLCVGYLMEIQEFFLQGGLLMKGKRILSWL